MTEILKRIYYDESHPASFGGVEKLWRAAKKDSPGITRLIAFFDLEYDTVQFSSFTGKR